MSETLEMDNPTETEKIRTPRARIVVDGTAEKPYYSIEWFDPAKNEYRLGYSSYYIENVVGWLTEYFEIVEKPKTNADRIRAMSDEELADFMARRKVTESCLRLADEGYTPTEEQKQVLYDSLYPVWMEWMQAPAEGE